MNNGNHEWGQKEVEISRTQNHYRNGNGLGAKEATKDGTRLAIPKAIFLTMDDKDDVNLGEGTQGMPIKSSLNNTKKDLFKAKVDELMPLSSYSNSSSDLNNKIGLNEKVVQQRWGLVLNTRPKK